MSEINHSQQRSGLAITSMILGIVSCLCVGLILGIPAMILGIVALNQISRDGKTGRGMAITGIVTGAFGTIVFIAIMAGMLLPALSQAREKARRLSCASNLKGMGLAFRMYSEDNGGFFPAYDGAEGLELLRKNGYLENTKMFVCPSSDTIPAADGEPLSENNIDYNYKGGLTEESDVENTLVWDKDSCHKRYGNILFVDGHVASFAGKNWQENLR